MLMALHYEPEQLSIRVIEDLEEMSRNWNVCSVQYILEKIGFLMISATQYGTIISRFSLSCAVLGYW